MLSLNPNLNVASRAATASASTDKALERLSSGLEINKASDNASGLTIAEGMRAQVMGSNQAARNIQDAINVVAIGQDGVAGLFPIMQRIRELIVQAGNSTNAPKDLSALQDEMDQLKNELPTAFDVAHQFNVALSINPAERKLVFQTGADNGQTETVDYNPLHDVLQAFTFQAFGYEELYNSPFQDQLKGTFGDPVPPPTTPAPPPFAPGQTLADVFPKRLLINPNTPDNLSTSFNLIDQTHEGLTQQDAYLGAESNKLQSQLNNVTNYSVNVDAAQSQIRDADMASEMIKLTRAQIQQNATLALVGQANTRPEVLLQLIKKAG